MLIRNRTWGALASAALLVAGSALAQNRTATVLVNVNQGGNAVTSGVKVVATNLQTGAVRKATARKDGSHVANALEPGQYLISATQESGKEVYREVALLVGQTVRIDVDLDVETQGETITILGKPNATAEVAVNVTREQIESLPRSSRNFIDFALLSPGVRIATDEFKKNFATGALDASANNVFVDGVSLKNNITEGGIVGQDSSRGNPFPQSAISGYRVITQNYKAEYEQAGGAVISATTRSGGNTYEGEVFSTLQHEEWMARDYFTLQRHEPIAELLRSQFGASAGGPIVKDKVHFFATYEGNLHNRSNLVSMNNDTPANQARFGNYEGSFVSPFREHLGFGKITWRPAENQTVDVTASLRTETDVRSFGGTTSFENAENVRNNVVTASARHQLFLAPLTNEATIQFFNFQFNPTALNPTEVGQDYEGVIRIGGRDTTQDIQQTSFTLRDDVTFPNLLAGGQHMVKTGAKVSLQRYSVDKLLFGNPLFRYRNDPANNLTYDFPFEANYGSGESVVSSWNTQVGLYAQDDWQPNKQVTVSLGVRWDVETNPLNNDYVTTDSVRAAAKALAANVNATNGADFFPVDNYLTDGTQRPPFLGAIQPRLGISMDVLGDGKTVIFAGAGRYYDRTLFNAGVDERYRLQYGVRTFRFSTDGAPRWGQPTIPWDPDYLTREGLDGLIASGTAPAPEIFLLENDTKPMHTDQYSAGLRQQVGPVNTSLTVTYVEGENGLGFYPANRRSTGTRDWVAPPTGFGNVLISVDDRESRYTSLQLVAEKRFSDELSGFGIQWGASVAYTYAQAMEKGGFFNFDFATVKDSPWAASASDERHRLVMSGSLGLPLEFKLSTLIVLGSGTPYNLYDASQGWGNFRFRPNEGRAEGFLQFSQVDVRLAKDFTIVKGSHKLGAYVEVFNLFNTANFGAYDGFIAPNTDTPNPNYGKPTGLAGPPRSVQAGVNYKF